mmetsp:Transcript_24670/g.40627  ORF Transcript_24670/g.40627 Transcript_24670/m.40627 type:complete len:217 (+) Transcript_24670:152-802(+)|eukprot:CAMPEP_0184652222 /NCGR_PEP_ID=MMETSP0308-20130426/9926_1 /TAXON_ID=38269 /ORGANISM="Gloeochaete witrockiana, Strain SAG 46.84" /LENGTH=216 /DNA_ID=CAMNT_0027086979 /DNA_START=126 /DNA_END=776 /DNA_ORIENTATION=-
MLSFLSACPLVLSGSSQLQFLSSTFQPIESRLACGIARRKILTLERSFVGHSLSYRLGTSGLRRFAFLSDIQNVASTDGEEESPSDSRAVRERLEQLISGKPEKAFTAHDLHQLVFQKWRLSYDVRLRKVAALNNQMVINVMWRAIEQPSFPMTNEEYLMNLEAIARILSEWGLVEFVRQSIIKSEQRPRVGKAVSIILPIPPERSEEWFNYKVKL